MKLSLSILHQLLCCCNYPKTCGTQCWTRTNIALRVKETYDLSTQLGNTIFITCYGTRCRIRTDDTSALQAAPLDLFGNLAFCGPPCPSQAAPRRSKRRMHSLHLTGDIVCVVPLLGIEPRTRPSQGLMISTSPQGHT